MPAPADQNIIQSMLAALGPTQNNRLLRLNTPLGNDVLLAERMHCTEAIGPGLSDDGQPLTAYRIEILALSTNVHLKLKDLIGQPVRLDVLTQQSRTELRPLHGHVTAFGLVGSDAGLARYHLVVEPFLAFLGHRVDHWVFQDKTVIEIVDEVLADYQGQGRLAPAWRWDLADASVYPRRSLCIQYAESDLAFIQRLLIEEGICFWAEHSAAEGDSLGSHTVVFTDHNGAFRPGVQPQVRFTQSGAASFAEDSLTQLVECRSVASTALSVSSWDHRSVQQAGARQEGDPRISPTGLQLPLRDQPGAYAFEDSAQASRIAQRQLEALQAVACQYNAAGPLRQAACGTTFQLREHPKLSADVQLATLAVTSKARNNITAGLGEQLRSLLGDVAPGFRLTSATRTPQGADGAPTPRTPSRATRPSLFAGQADLAHLPNDSDEPLYQARLTVQDLRIPVRAPSPRRTAQGDLLFQRPHIAGEHTALVVGLGGPVHTDRDGRIKIQFHWQRGAESAHRLSHAAGSNAPADDSTGTWVRVSQRQAGANWGGHFIPRLGQEVKVGFVEGDPDRPVVTGSVYNGVGQVDGQGNQVPGGAARATGNAGAWFPGSRTVGEHQGHAHTAVLSGIKTQALGTSQGGMGGYNQLVFDDSPAQARMQLGTTQAATWLGLGHLIHQNDNQRLAQRGHGLELITAAQGALRAGSGLYVATHSTAPGSAANVQPSDARPAIDLLDQARERTLSLADTAQQHKALLGSEPAPKELPVALNQDGLIESQRATDSRGGQGGGAAREDGMLAIDGGHGSVAAPSRPDLMVYADGGIALGTPAHSVYTAGTTLSLNAGQDLQLNSQRHTAVIVAKGTSLFTYGKASNPNKPNTETGIQLHAASGNVHVQASDNTLHLTADKAVSFASVTNAITMGAPKHILLTAGGSAIRLEGGKITLTTPGTATFKASMKELTGASSGSTSLSLPTSKLAECPTFVAMAGAGGASAI